MTKAIATAKKQVELNKSHHGCHAEKKNASDQVNQDADRKSTDLKKLWCLLTLKNTGSFFSWWSRSKLGTKPKLDDKKQTQTEWQKKYDELRAKTRKAT